MPKCAFCGTQIEKGTGKLFIYNSGKSDYFCTNKCEKNLLVLKRKPLKIRWTEAYRKEHKKGLKEEVPKAEKKVVKAPEVKEEPKAEKTKDSKDSGPASEEQKPVEEVPKAKIEEKKE